MVEERVEELVALMRSELRTLTPSARAAISEVLNNATLCAEIAVANRGLKAEVAQALVVMFTERAANIVEHGPAEWCDSDICDVFNSLLRGVLRGPARTRAKKR